MNTGTKIRKQDNPKLTHNQNIRGKIRICDNKKNMRSSNWKCRNSINKLIIIAGATNLRGIH